MDEIMNQPKEIIYLQCWDEWGEFIPKDIGTITWCEDCINDNDEPYIRLQTFNDLILYFQEYLETGDERNLINFLKRLENDKEYMRGLNQLDESGKSIYSC